MRVRSLGRVLTLLRFSENITQYIEGLSKLSRHIYQRITAYQRDDITDRDTLAEVHQKYEQANLELGRLTELWLLMQHTSRCMLFGSPEHDAEPDDPLQPPPSPANDSGFEIMIEQAFAFQSTSNQGIKPREQASPSTEPEKATSPTSGWHFALVALKTALRLVRIFSS
ncbi:MAG: hypothetical protein Q9212_007048 [Teloschistes hypoglaucus]